MPALRIIPCLDVKDGMVVKGVKFQNLQNVSEPVTLATKYYEQGADEITILDVSASLEGRLAIIEVVEQCANEIFVPLTVGGGIRSVAEVKTLLAAGADKVSVGSAGLADPNLISDIATTFGNQVLVVSLDVKRGSTRSGFVLTRLGGTQETAIDAMTYIGQLSARGAGELLVNSIDADGTQQGFDLELMRIVRETTDLPIIASGGAGTAADFIAAAKCGPNALLAASVFHSSSLTIGQVKVALDNAELEVRI